MLKSFKVYYSHHTESFKKRKKDAKRYSRKDIVERDRLTCALLAAGHPGPVRTSRPALWLRIPKWWPSPRQVQGRVLKNIQGGGMEEGLDVQRSEVVRRGDRYWTWRGESKGKSLTPMILQMLGFSKKAGSSVCRNAHSGLWDCLDFCKDILILMNWKYFLFDPQVPWGHTAFRGYLGTLLLNQSERQHLCFYALLYGTPSVPRYL